MAGASVSQATTSGELEYSNQAKSAKLTQLMSKINLAKRKVILLQTELSDLKSAELGVLQKMNTQIRLEHLERYYPSDKDLNTQPLPGTRPSKPSIIDPDPRISWTRNQLKNGNEPLVAERNRIGSEILKISQQIQIQRFILDSCQISLTEMGSDIQIYMDKDAIAKRAYSETYMLYEIHLKYRKLTVDETGERKYTDSAVILADIQILSEKFKAFGLRNQYVINSTLKLDFTDPGASMNGAALLQILEQFRKVMDGDSAKKLDAKLQKSSDQMLSNLNDPWISKELLRQVETGREPDISAQLRVQTSTPTKLATFVNSAVNWADKITGPIHLNYNFDSKANSVKSFFSRYTTGLYNGIPYCNPSTPTPGESAQVSSDVKAKSDEVAGGAKFSKQLEDAKVKESLAVKTIPNFGYNLKAAINNKSNQITVASFSITIAPALSTWNIKEADEYGPSRTIYEFNIIKEARALYESLFVYRYNGDVATFDFYVTELIRLLNSVNPPLSIRLGV